ncbi:unnamed protein product [Durusdinium trenchii]|uniref:Uncharacterized protein n=2 Tax=Durusdinium trenchii TaxID=1381693 RepID=A0ABP0N593_9DINO
MPCASSSHLWSSFQGAGTTAPNAAGPPNEMAEAASQWARHAAFTASRAAQAAQYASQQAQMATNSAQNAVAQVSYLMNNPDLRSAAAAGFGGDLADGLCGATQILTVRQLLPDFDAKHKRTWHTFL